MLAVVVVVCKITIYSSSNINNKNFTNIFDRFVVKLLSKTFCINFLEKTIFFESYSLFESKWYKMCPKFLYPVSCVISSSCVYLLIRQCHENKSIISIKDGLLSSNIRSPELRRFASKVCIMSLGGSTENFKFIIT